MNTTETTHEILFSTDVDILQSTLVVNSANMDFENNCFYLIPVDDDKFQVYCFDLLDDLNGWFNLKEIDSFCDTNYSEKTNADMSFNDWCNLTNDVCSLYGAINFASPTLINSDKVEEYILY